MKFYIASSFRNIANVRLAAILLKHGGHVQTYDWTACSDEALSLEELGEIGLGEMKAVLEADVFIMMMPAGKGSHVELGLALGRGKQIILYSETDEIHAPESTTTFYQLKEVRKYVGALEGFLAFLAAEDWRKTDSAAPYTIRPIDRNDTPFLWDMLYESLYVPEGGQPFGREIVQEPFLAKYVEGWGRAGDFGFIAMDGEGRRIGSITARCFGADDQGYGYVSEDVPEIGTAVLPAYRGQGIGTALLQALVDEARDRRIRALSLSVDPMNQAAMKLYRRFAFEEAGMNGTSMTMIADLTRREPE
ncbi:GNAT family N-acetyltransferase [Paenibacillus lycopersici]|nr:GNAT family N-acetyltransferase [Paenibacillus lycopersici]